MTVYLIRHPGDNAVKIGYTDGDPLDRLSSLQTASASVLELLSIIPDAPRQVEQALHAKFADLRVRPNGEWFRDDAVIYGVFKEHRAANHRDHLVAQVGEVLATLSEAFSGAGTPSAGRLEQAIRDVHQVTGQLPCDCFVSTRPFVDPAVTEGMSDVEVFLTHYSSEYCRPFLPFAMLHAHYSAWLRKTRPASMVLSASAFTRELKVLADPTKWFAPKGADGKDLRVTTAHWLQIPEPVLSDYSYAMSVSKWQVPEGSLDLGAATPRQARGLIQRDVFEEYQARLEAGATPGRTLVNAVVCDVQRAG